jgi:hypothetical protein
MAQWTQRIHWSLPVAQSYWLLQSSFDSVFMLLERLLPAGAHTHADTPMRAFRYDG